MPPTSRSTSRARKPTTTLEIVRLVTELSGKDLAPEHVEPEAGKVSLTSGGAWKMDHARPSGPSAGSPQVDMREGIKRLLAWREASGK